MTSPGPISRTGTDAGPGAVDHDLGARRHLAGRVAVGPVRRAGRAVPPRSAHGRKTRVGLGHQRRHRVPRPGAARPAAPARRSARRRRCGSRRARPRRSAGRREHVRGGGSAGRRVGQQTGTPSGPTDDLGVAGTAPGRPAPASERVASLPNATPASRTHERRRGEPLGVGQLEELAVGEVVDRPGSVAGGSTRRSAADGDREAPGVARHEGADPVDVAVEVFSGTTPWRTSSRPRGCSSSASPARDGPQTDQLGRRRPAARSASWSGSSSRVSDLGRPRRGSRVTTSPAAADEGPVERRRCSPTTGCRRWPCPATRSGIGPSSMPRTSTLNRFRRAALELHAGLEVGDEVRRPELDQHVEADVALDAEAVRGRVEGGAWRRTAGCST